MHPSCDPWVYEGRQQTGSFRALECGSSPERPLSNTTKNEVDIPSLVPAHGRDSSSAESDESVAAGGPKAAPTSVSPCSFVMFGGGPAALTCRCNSSASPHPAVLYRQVPSPKTKGQRAKETRPLPDLESNVEPRSFPGPILPEAPKHLVCTLCTALRRQKNNDRQNDQKVGQRL